MSALPSYDDLPVTPGAPAGSSWGLWGERDLFGCLNLIDTAATQRGLASARRGRVFNLNLELELPDPPGFGRSAHTHTTTSHSPVVSDDLIGDFNTQRSSQWDGFRHVRSVAFGAYSGIPEEEHGIHAWARRGIATRGVLADVARWRAAQGRPIDCSTSDAITPDDVLATLAEQGTTVEPGDILLLRTGWVDWYRGTNAGQRASYAAVGAAPGLASGEDSARMLWDLHVAAVAADNPSLEVWPPPVVANGPPADLTDFADPAKAAALFLHMSLLPLLGLPIGELWDLDGLAADCGADGDWTCLLTSAPLNLAHGVASPPNALALR